MKLNFLPIHLLLLVNILSGCATLSKEECLQGDWYAIGYKDGANGYGVERLAEHSEACREHGAGVQADAYTQGRRVGLTYHCAESTVYKRESHAIHSDRGDWQAIGYGHGEAGRIFQPEYYQSRCAQYGITLANSEYTDGYRQGLQQYCQPHRAYDLGRNGNAYPRGLCGKQERPFLNAYIQGLDSAISSVDQDISSKMNESSASAAQLRKVEPRDKNYNSLQEKSNSLARQLDDLRERREKLRRLRESAVYY